MKLSIRGMTVAGAAMWGGAMLLTGLANLQEPHYGEPFLRLMASVYPGYRGSRNATSSSARLTARLTEPSAKHCSA
ncbi:MAG: hypothetical protein M1541_15935 [Acidobacteria bacterium]|nr:hypothetical protein [Acidobacteriota bacterium]